MTLTQLRYLVAIADAGLNITLAAARVHATQPGLSKQLKQLEDELGFLLFVRKGRSLESVTPAGAEVLARARVILAETANIRAYAANQRRDSQGQLTITTTHTQARFVLPPAIARIKRDFPQVSVHLQQSAEGAALDLLGTGSEPQGGIAVPLYRWKRLALVPRGHELDRAGRAPELEELSRYPLISYESSVRPDSSLRRAFAQAGLEPDLALTALDADLIKTYVRAGLGVGILAEMAVGSGDTDLRSWPAPVEISECIAWAVLPRERVLRDYALDLVHALAPQIDRRDLRRVIDGNQEPDWPPPPSWESLTQTITS